MKFFHGSDINEGLSKMRNRNGAVLLDVRTREEYAQAHIPGGINIPLTEIQMVAERIPAKSTPLFVHCLSGVRSRQAVRLLKQYGYQEVTDLGGIQHYRGQLERNSG